MNQDLEVPDSGRRGAIPVAPGFLYCKASKWILIQPDFSNEYKKSTPFGCKEWTRSL